MTTADFTVLYNSLSPKVYRLCLGYLNGDHNLAQEITQETFIKVWTHSSSYRGEASLSTWVYRIAINLCLSHHRKKKIEISFQENMSITDIQNQETTELQDTTALYACINKLQASHKAIILLELEEIPQKEIALTVGIEHNALRTRISRIKQSLLKCLNHGK